MPEALYIDELRNAEMYPLEKYIMGQSFHFISKGDILLQ